MEVWTGLLSCVYMRLRSSLCRLKGAGINSSIPIMLSAALHALALVNLACTLSTICYWKLPLLIEVWITIPIMMAFNLV
jgi:hypothetical protein